LLATDAVRSGRAALDGEIIQSAIGSIHEVLHVIANAVHSITDVVDLIVRLKSTFSDCTAQILELALRLRIVALNAQVFAAHVEAGTSLEVVARNTRLITDQSMHQLDEISSSVNEVVDAVKDLEQRLRDYAEVAAMEQKLLTDEAGDSETKLRGLDAGLRASMSAIGPMEAQLTQSVQRLIRSIHFPAAVAQAETRSITLFEEIAGLHTDADSDAHHKLDDLKRNYTMAHERTVHENAVDGRRHMSIETNSASFDPDRAAAQVVEHEVGGFQESPALTPVDAVQEEKLAENVELF
jgi:hypothetical protein